MKKIILSIGFLIAMASFSGTEAANINVNINIGMQPAWGPVGYNYVAFYYFPDINVYYNVNQGLFHFPRGGRWVSARYLPGAYRHYDLYGLYKVVLTDNNPWRFNQRHMVDYRHFRGDRNQVVIRNSHDNRYRDSRRNEVSWYDDNNRGNNNGRGRDSDYERINGRDNRVKSAPDRQHDSNRSSRDNNYRDENRRTDRSSGRNDLKYAEESRSRTENTNRNRRERESENKGDNRYSSRSETGRSSASGRR